MISECRGYLVSLLQEIGVSRVNTDAEGGGKHQAAPFAQLMQGKEKFEYDGSLVARKLDAENEQYLYRRRIYRHMAQVKVRITHRSGDEATAAKRDFLANLSRRIWDENNNAVLVSVPESSPEDDSSLLKQQDAAVVMVTFEGGVYKDYAIPIFDLSSALVIETETGEV
ncbi:MAG: hypothetical protein FH756_02340 [Firmicutes bacterium]|nr:hypothetical protein [Bacillota bacterium]